MQTPALDESTIPNRPIAYPLFLSIAGDTTALGLSATSENGILTIWKLSPESSVEAELTATRRQNEHTYPRDFSVMPAYDTGQVLWRGSIRNKPSRFIVAGDDTGLTLSTLAGKRLWNVSSPPPQLTLAIKKDRTASLLNAAGHKLWLGQAPSNPSGYSATGANPCTVNVAGLRLSLIPGHSLRLSDGRNVLWYAPVSDEPNVLKIVEPYQAWILVAFSSPTGSPSFVAWQTDMKASVDVGVERGTVKVHDDAGRVSGSRQVDMGTMTWESLPNGKALDFVSTDLALVTPVPPLYVDGDVLHATYTRDDGRLTCDETIRYETGSVTRQVSCTFPHGTSMTNSSYPAPNRPKSIAWNW
jgi:hypothetical protein